MTSEKVIDATNKIIENENSGGKSVIFQSLEVQYSRTELLFRTEEAVPFTTFTADNPWWIIIQFKP